MVAYHMHNSSGPPRTVPELERIRRFQDAQFSEAWSPTQPWKGDAFREPGVFNSVFRGAVSESSTPVVEAEPTSSLASGLAAGAV